MTQSILKAAAGIAALAAIAFGASAIASGSKSSNASFAGAPPGAPAAAGQAPGGVAGQAPPGGRPGFGTPVTGDAADKAKAAALAKYPGTVEKVEAAPDGSGYVVHVIRSGGEVHVLVSKQFEVTGTFAGPPRGGMPPQGAPRPGATPQAPQQQAPKSKDGSTT
jgi:hypothetical protein